MATHKRHGEMKISQKEGKKKKNFFLKKEAAGKLIIIIRPEVNGSRPPI